jgi:hypothetical protein
LFSREVASKGLISHLSANREVLEFAGVLGRLDVFDTLRELGLGL